jgi:hypothetical protein
MPEFSQEAAQPLVTAAEQIEGYRRKVNEAYTQAPDSLDSDFISALDQIADYQYKLTESWKKLGEGDIPTAQTEAVSASQGALRAALVALRAFAEARQRDAERLTIQLRELRADVSDVLEIKGKYETKFKTAVALHESNKPEAVESLLESVDDYEDFAQKASAKIAGTRKLTARETRRQQLAYTGLIALVITLIGRENILAAAKYLWALFVR